MKTHRKKKQTGPEGQLRKSRRKQGETASTEEAEGPVVMKVEDEIKSEVLLLFLDTAAITQGVQASLSNTCALLREMVADC